MSLDPLKHEVRLHENEVLLIALIILLALLIIIIIVQDSPADQTAAA